jgi:hypothetical protein
VTKHLRLLVDGLGEPGLSGREYGIIHSDALAGPPWRLASTVEGSGREAIMFTPYRRFMVGIVALLALTVGCEPTGEVDAFEPFGAVFVADTAIVLRASPDDPVGAVQDVAMWDGRIAVADRLGKNIKVFGSGGDLQFTLGRVGDGPGEFRYPLALGIVEGGRLAALDMALGRVYMYREGGEIDRSFSFNGVFTGDMAVLSGGRELAIGTRIRVPADSAGLDSSDPSSQIIHVFSLDGSRREGLGALPEPRSRAETPFMGMRLATDGERAIAWGTVGRPQIMVRAGEGDDVDTLTVPGIEPVDWSEAPEDAGELFEWVMDYPLLTGLSMDEDWLIARFQGGDGRRGQEWYQYAVIPMSRPTEAIVTERTEILIDELVNGEAVGVEIRDDGRTYLTRLALRVSPRQ